MSESADKLFIDTGSSHCTHFDERICGDVVIFRRLPDEDRMIAVLADGLGHGVKANILATMTATMALRFVAEDREIVHSAEIIMDASPSAGTGKSVIPRSRLSISVPAAGSMWLKWAILRFFFFAKARFIASPAARSFRRSTGTV